MFCTQCGANVADGAPFCPNCGVAFAAPQAPVNNYYAAPSAAPQAPANDYYAAAPQTPANDYYAAAPQAPVNDYNEYYAAMPPVEPRKKKNTGLIIGIVVAAIVIIAGVVGALFATGLIGKSDEEQIQEIAEETADKIERGTISENIYTNDSVGIKFEKPDDWKFATDDELAQMMSAGQEIVNLDDMEKALSEAVTVYDMAATSSDSTQTVAVAFINIEKADIEGMSEEEYLEQCRTEFDNLDSSELSYDCGDIIDVKLSGETFSCLEMTLNSFFYQNLYARIEGDVLILVTLASAYENGISEAEAMFS